MSTSSLSSFRLNAERRLSLGYFQGHTPVTDGASTVVGRVTDLPNSGVRRLLVDKDPKPV